MKAVIAQNLQKTYRLYARPADRIFEAATARRRHQPFPALAGISFEVEAGETIGLIGRNGAGKSTLLKLLCGVTTPTSGHLEVHGSLASILELGTGFHPEFTGRENAALNAAILGLSPNEIRQRLPEIFLFSELGEFLDRPVKTYSSGMYMRLAFSVAVHAHPDILVIDEALAVGDGHFQRKCIDRIRETQQSGTTIFFCSHALFMVTGLCTRTLWLEEGRIAAFGPTNEVVAQYERFLEGDHRQDSAQEPANPLTPIRIAGIAVLDRSGVARRDFTTGESIALRIDVTSREPWRPIHLLVGVTRESDEMQCFAVATKSDGVDPLRDHESYQVDLTIENVPLLAGEYRLVAFAGDEHALHVYDRRDFPNAFSMRGKTSGGVIAVDHEWTASA